MNTEDNKKNTTSHEKEIDCKNKKNITHSHAGQRLPVYDVPHRYDESPGVGRDL